MQWIEQLGFWGWMQKYPVNPVTIVGAVVVIGVIVLYVNASVKRGKANKYLEKNPLAALMMFHKKKTGDTDYADNIRLVTLNGRQADWFMVRMVLPAIYLNPGENKIELYAEWARGGGVAIKMFKTEPVTITVTAAMKGSYSLEYCISEDRYIFEPFVLP